MPTLLADLGQPVVLRFYQLAQKEPTVIAICAISESSSSVSAQYSSPILAYALGSPSPSAINAQLRQPLSWFAAQLLRLALTRPAILWQLAQSVFSSSNENALTPGQLELTYIGVALEARGHGLGKILLTAFVDAARNAGYNSVVLSVETDNSVAVSLYTKFGFHTTRTFREGHYHRHRMEYNISKQVNR
jgi:GNAT superfamily N-acetyltransferase